MSSSRAPRRSRAATKHGSVIDTVSTPQEPQVTSRTRSQLAQQRPQTRSQTRTALRGSSPVSVGPTKQSLRRSGRLRNQSNSKFTVNKSQESSTKPAKKVTTSTAREPPIQTRIKTASKPSKRTPAITVPKPPKQPAPKAKSSDAGERQQPIPDRAQSEQLVRTRPRLQYTATQSVSVNPAFISQVTPWIESVSSGSPGAATDKSGDLLDIASLSDFERPSAGSDFTFGEAMPAGARSNVSRATTISDQRYLLLLLDRNADPEEEANSTDPWDFISELKSETSTSKDFVLPVRQADSLFNITQTFLKAIQRARSMGSEQNVMPAVDNFRERFHAALPEHMISTTTKAEFMKDKALSRKSSEHVLQRTLMMSVIDRWHLDPMFRFNCEKLWASDNPVKLHTSGKKDLPLNKPDLAIYFNAADIRGNRSENIAVVDKDRLSYCYAPDNDRRRWFPFLFIETKKPDVGLTHAQYRNMHHASQALLHISTCLGKAGRLDKFAEVRTFSIVLTPDIIEARVHRAESTNDDNDSGQANPWRYRFDTLHTSRDYQRDEVALLIHTILQKYAKPKLSKILKETFDELYRLGREVAHQELGADRHPNNITKEAAPPTGAINGGQSSNAGAQSFIAEAPSFNDTPTDVGSIASQSQSELIYSQSHNNLPALSNPSFAASSQGSKSSAVKRRNSQNIADSKAKKKANKK